MIIIDTTSSIPKYKQIIFSIEKAILLNQLEKNDKLPSITHIDNTCRIQTLKKEQNEHYYNLILSFYNKTGIPVLFNTSFNLAGDCIVETLQDALNSFKKSSIDYLYLPEYELLIE